MSDKRVTAARDAFRSLIVDNYEMDGEFVDKVCEFWTQTVTSLLETVPVAATTVSVAATPKKRTTKTNSAATTDSTLVESDKPKQRRKKSAYNVYVREMMKTDDIQQLDHRQKMRAIADQWRTLDDVGKATYVSIAAVENETVPEEPVS